MDWVKENFSTLTQKIDNLEALTFDQVIKKIESDPFLGYPASLIAEEMKEEVPAEDRGGNKEVPIHEYNLKKTQEMEKLEQMKRELIEQYVYDDDEAEQQEEELRRQHAQKEKMKKYY